MEITPTTRLSLNDVTTIKKITDIWSNPYDRKNLTSAQQRALKLLETITPDLPLERLCPAFKIAPSKIMQEIERAQKTLLLQTLAENTRLFKANQKLQAANKQLQAKNVYLQHAEEQKEKLAKIATKLKEYATKKPPSYQNFLKKAG